MKSRVLGVDLLGYARSSTDEQSRSIAQQIYEWWRAWKAAGVTLPVVVAPKAHSPALGLYADDGVSGWKHAPDDRPASRELLRHCMEHRRPKDAPGVILIWALSRFGRFADGPMEAFHWLYEFHRLGWTFWSLQEGDLSCTDSDRVLKVLKIALHSEKDTASSEDKSTGVARGAADAVRSGYWGAGEAPYGYSRWAARITDGGEITWLEELPPGKRNGYAADGCATLLRPNSSAPTARLIWDLAARGDSRGDAMSTWRIAARLNHDGVPTPRGARSWYANTVGLILSNEAYRARQSTGGEWYDAKWERLVDDDTWQLVRARLRDNRTRRRGVNSAYLLSGLVRCSACGLRMFGQHNHSRGRRKRTLRYYSTRTTAGGRRCAPCAACARRVRADVLEPAIIEAVAALADHPIVRHTVAEEAAVASGKTTPRRERIHALEREQRELQEQSARLVDLVRMGGVVGRQAAENAETLNDRGTQVERMIVALRSESSARLPATEHATAARDFAAVFAKAPMEARKQLLARFIVRIDVDVPRRVLRVHYRAPDGMPGPV